MIVCIDTHVLIQAAKAGHPLNVIFTGWLQRKFLWAVSNDILNEYEEILTQRSGRRRWLQFSRVLDLAEAQGGLLLHARPSLQFHVITTDLDDNKFTDCAITVSADYVIRHIMSGIFFAPAPQPTRHRHKLAPSRNTRMRCGWDGMGGRMDHLGLLAQSSGINTGITLFPWRR
jgi:predicted nucleic acid-binding protein